MTPAARALITFLAELLVADRRVELEHQVDPVPQQADNPPDARRPLRPLLDRQSAPHVD